VNVGAIQELDSLRSQLEERLNLHDRIASRMHVPSIEEIKNSDYIACAKDRDGKMLAVSKGYSQAFGISDLEYSGKLDSAVWAADGQDFEDHDRFVRETGVTFEGYEAWFNAKEGEYQMALVIKRPYKDGGTRMNIPRDSLKIINEEEYKAFKNGC